MPLKTAFSTLACPDWSWQQIIDCGPRFGYDGVEVRLLRSETDLLQRPEFAADVLEQRRTELWERGFQVCGLSSSVRFDYPEAEVRREQARIGKAYVDLAGQLGATFVRVFGDVLPPLDQPDARKRVMDQIAAGLQEVGEYAQTRGIDVLIETHGDFADSRLMVELLGGVQSPAVGVLWDTHHPWRFFGEELAATYARLKPWVKHTHWKDSVTRPQREETAESLAAEDRAKSLMSGHRAADYALFCGGEFPAAECLRVLLEGGYEGWFSLEWEKAWHPTIEDPEIALPLFPAKIRQLAQFVHRAVS